MKVKILQNCRTIILIIALLICVAVAVVFLYGRYAKEILDEEEITEINFINSTNIDNETCTTKGCNKTAATLLENINFNVDPCNNFFEFTCGNFVKNKKIPKDKSNIQTIMILTDKVEDQILEIISEDIEPNEIKPFKITKQLFKACMDEKSIQQRGKAPLIHILKKLGGWPILEKNNWNETKFNWSDTLITIAKIGLIPDVLFSVYIDNDFKNNTNYILAVDEPLLGIDREYFIQGLENDVVSAYFEYMNNIAVALGAEEIPAREQLKEILVFEMNLANHTLSIPERENISNLYNIRSIKQLQQKYPTIPWLHYLNNMLYSMVNLTENEQLILTVPKYIQEIEKLIQNTPKRVLANYIIWRVIKQTVPYLSQDYYQYNDEFQTSISGIKSQPTREKKCVMRIENEMGVAISSLYVRKYFKKQAKVDMVELVTNIRAELKKLLENVDWMDNKTRKSALKKIDAVYSHVAYPDELLDDSQLTEYYKNLTVNDRQYLESALNLSIFQNKRYILETREPYNKTKWTRHSISADINAYYSPQENSIELPAGILQGEFFTSDRPKYMNYGGIGFVVGHELTHGFDDFGRMFDKEGNMVNWWEDSTDEAYKKKAKCIINQYGNYSTGNLTVNGENTHNENIADNGGIKIAYRAYQRWAKLNDVEPSLPGLSFTPSQMFWISMGTTWCSKYRQEYLRDIILTDVHSPAQFRVNGVVSNQETFAKDFGCPKGSPMNPEKKCVVW